MVMGSGLMGSGIADKSALAGNETLLVDNKISLAENGYEKA